MTPIFYDETAELLDMSVGTLRHAVSRKVLTKLPADGQRARLIREQVMLFVHPKKRLSLAALTPQERRQWEQYANEARLSVLPTEDASLMRSVVGEEVERRLAPLLQEAEALNTQEAEAKAKLAAIQGEKEGYRKALSLLRRRAEAIA